MAYSAYPATTSVGSTAFTASDAVVGAPDGNGTIVSGASTAGSIVSLAIPDGMQTWILLLKAYVSGTIYTEASTNSTNGTDGDWVEVKGRRTGTAPGTESVVYAMVSNGYYRGNCSGFRYLRARLIGATGPTARFELSTALGPTFLNSGIPAGSSNIGTVNTVFGSLPSANVVSKSGTITTGGTAQTLAAANSARTGLTIQNTHASADLWLTEDGSTTAALNTGYKLIAGASANINTQKSISIWGATTGQTFAATEF